MFDESLETLRKFKQYLNIERERNLLMKDLSEILGYDVTFSEEEMYNNAMHNMTLKLGKTIKKEMVQWMK